MSPLRKFFQGDMHDDDFYRVCKFLSIWSAALFAGLLLLHYVNTWGL